MKSLAVVMVSLVILLMGYVGLIFWAAYEIDQQESINQQLRNTIAFQSAYIDSLESGVEVDAWKQKQMWDVILEGE